MSNALRGDGQTRKFLIVDDHAAFRQTIRAFLPSGAIAECADGNEVLARYAAERPDWVLMDIEMCGMDGLTAMRELKARFPEARVIIVSNHGSEEFRNTAHELGAWGFVHKAHLEELPRIMGSSDKTNGQQQLAGETATNHKKKQP